MPLTPEDIDAIKLAIRDHSACNLGLTPIEASSLKRFLGAADTTAGWIGKMVVTFVVMALFAILTKGFWASIVAGIKGGTP